MENNKTNVIEKIVLTFSVICLILLTLIMMGDIRKIQGNARVINYVGLVRGATQREIKLEIANQPNDDLIQYLDNIFSGLMHGGSKYQLTTLDDEDYNKNLQIQYDAWNKLKEEIQEVRNKGYEQTNIIADSEEYFHLADNTVSSAEAYAQDYATKVNTLERVLIVFIVVVIVLIIKESLDTIMLMKKNKELKRKAYIDLHTGLPNKSRCEELLNQVDYLETPTAIVIFDLNNLKEVNDNLGHIAGDTLIMNFAHIIRSTIPQEYFVGRYGGDEFVAILDNVDDDRIHEIINYVFEETKKYNTSNNPIYIDFAYGYALSTHFKETNLKLLLNQADKAMYEYKAKMKELKKNPAN